MKLNAPAHPLSIASMKHSSVIVQWSAGLHMRPAVRLVRVAQQFRSSISLKFGGQIADLRSILSVIALCATLGTSLDVEVNGDDEQTALDAIEQVFSADDDDATPRGDAR